MHFHKIIAGLFLAISLSACASHDVRNDPPGVLVITRDNGGHMMRRVAEIQKLERAGTPVIIRGRCASACTMYLALPQTCVEPQARLGFHGPSHEDPGRGLRPEVRRTAVNLISTHYPESIAKWFKEEGHKRVGHQFYWKSGTEVVSMGARPCPTERKASIK